MTKTTQPLLSQTQLATNMNNSIGNTTIGEAIARNHGLLGHHFFDSLHNLDDYTQLLESIRAVTDNPALQAKLETCWEDEDIQQDEEFNTLLHQVRYACLYLELGSTAEAQKNSDRAWAFTNYASVMVGEIIEKSAAILNEREVERRALQNSKNGKGRIKNFVPVKQEAVRLLKAMKPEGGWPNIDSAIDALETPLANFIRENHISGLTPTNIRPLLKQTWIPKDELVNQAWKENKKSKK